MATKTTTKTYANGGIKRTTTTTYASGNKQVKETWIKKPKKK